MYSGAGMSMADARSYLPPPWASTQWPASFQGGSQPAFATSAGPTPTAPAPISSAPLAKKSSVMTMAMMGMAIFLVTMIVTSISRRLEDARKQRDPVERGTARRMRNKIRAIQNLLKSEVHDADHSTKVYEALTYIDALCEVFTLEQLKQITGVDIAVLKADLNHHVDWDLNSCL